MKNIVPTLLALAVFCFAIPGVYADNSLNSTLGIIYSPQNYVVRDSGFNTTFKAHAMFGTPCFAPPYYEYEWYLNDTLIGTSEEFSISLEDYTPGNYTLTVNVTDCMNRKAAETTTLYLVDTLKVKIESIKAGGTTIYSMNCTNPACDASACNPQGYRNAADDYSGGKEYFYNRTATPASSMLYLTYDGSLLYEITQPDVKVLFPDKCNVNGCNPKSFYTLAYEQTTGEYYFLIAEDSFMGGLPNVPGNWCKNICNAFLDDFIPFTSQILICGADNVTQPTRLIGTVNGYTEVIAANSGNGKKVHYIFSDNMQVFFAAKGWSYNGLGVDSGTSRLTINSLCSVNQPMDYTADKCLLNFSATVTGGLPPYNVKWVSSGDGVINRFTLASDPGIYDYLSTPPMTPPLSNGTHNISFYAQDQLGLSAEDTWPEARIPGCCAIMTPCHKYWPGREGPIVDTGNEESYSCDIYEVCRPELWQRAREGIYCCENNCSAGCLKECKTAYNFSKDMVQSNGMLTPDGVKKCAGLYLIYGFGPGRKYLTDYYYPETCCMGDTTTCSTSGDANCCPGDIGTCSCGYHTYTVNANSLQCKDYVSTSSKGWKSDIAMNLNTCMFADLPAYASMEVINTGTCCDYANSLTTMLRIVGYGPDEVYAATGPSHCFTLVKFPNSPKYNLIEVTGNWETPYTPYGISGYPGYPYCSYFNCRNDAGTFTCPANTNVWGC